MDLLSLILTSPIPIQTIISALNDGNIQVMIDLRACFVTHGEILSEFTWEIAIASIPHIHQISHANELFRMCIDAMKPLEALMMLTADAMAVIASVPEVTAAVLLEICRIFLSLPIKSRYKHIDAVFEALKHANSALMCQIVRELWNGDISFKYSPITEHTTQNVDQLYLHHMAVALGLWSLAKQPNVELMACLKKIDLCYIMDRTTDDGDSEYVPTFSKLGVAVYLSAIMDMDGEYSPLYMPQVYSPSHLLILHLPFIEVLLNSDYINRGAMMMLKYAEMVPKRTFYHEMHRIVMNRLVELSATVSTDGIRENLCMSLRVFVDILGDPLRYSAAKKMLTSQFSNIAAFGVYVMKEGYANASFEAYDIVELMPLLFPLEIILNPDVLEARIDQMHAAVLFVQFILQRGNGDIPIYEYIDPLKRSLDQVKGRAKHPLLGQVWMVESVVEEIGRLLA